MTGIQTKQDLYTNSCKITINWGTIQVLENVFYTKVSRIRLLTTTHKIFKGMREFKSLAIHERKQ